MHIYFLNHTKSILNLSQDKQNIKYLLRDFMRAYHMKMMSTACSDNAYRMSDFEILSCIHLGCIQVAMHFSLKL